MARSQQSQLREKPCSLLHTKAKQTQGLPFSHLKRRGRMLGWVWAPSPPQALPHQVTQVPLPEPTCTPLAVVGCARAISAGLCSSCRSGRQWLDHTHYICVSGYRCQLAACGVDPISKAPDSQLCQGRAVCIAHQRCIWRQNTRLLLDRAAACPRDRTAGTKVMAKGGGA